MKAHYQITIIILAHNEADIIEKTLKTLFSQTIFKKNDIFLNNVVCIPNGCTDSTFDKAKTLLEKNAAHYKYSYFIKELNRAGKSNAWNYAVHELKHRENEVFIFLDADIEIVEPDNLERLILSFEKYKKMRVATSRPMKDIYFEKKKTFGEKLSLEVSASTAKATSIAGSLYCVARNTIEKIVMPIDLSVEDGFLRAMILTEGFTKKENLSFIRQIDGCTHSFEAEKSPKKIFRHSTRIILGATMNSFLFDYVSKNKSEFCAGNFIRAKNNEDPEWYSSEMNNYIAKNIFFSVPYRIMFKRFINFKKNPKLVKIPLVFLATIYDILISINVNIVLKKKKGIGFW